MWILFNCLLTLTSAASCDDPNCNTCTSFPNCDTCNTGYYLSGTTCSQCNNKCTACTLPDNCSDCISGFKLFEGYCCPSACSSCDWVKCLGCVDGYLYDSESGTCTSCPSSCSACIEGDCLVIDCSPDYYPVGDNCVKCDSRCATCSSAEVCHECQDGYHLVEGFCCSTACSSCDLSRCWGCVTGYLYDSESGICGSCPSECAECTEGHCLVIDCAPGYYLVGTNCVQCDSRCAFCSSVEVCHVCLDGFSLINGYCCLEGCTSCNLNKCWGCSDGYYYDGTSCFKCPEFCSACGSKGKCTTCLEGYYESSGICYACDSKCATCSSFRECTSCNDNYYLVGRFCCLEGCSACKFNSDDCSKCFDGYTLDKKNKICV